ncbi:hypothetical protein HKI81_04215 [Caldanaerobacter subterraneus]|uniref:Uncharacterized protein n=1 Tax=Caldanaerobacter subterraneus TaxID=911092 RepID=A0A7Y2PJZ8_9THEO|nr:DUF6166 domain-containing protein [Caldanaerobacter subterraneus]NNG66444.1 hypothetical protein [Caldanaerobacter subterraneus]
MENVIILKRDERGNAIANIPQVIVSHSPSGFEWGYGGSGPADLALNILYAVTKNREIAYEYHQEYKWDVISKIPYEGTVITYEEVLDWLSKKGVDISNFQ